VIVTHSAEYVSVLFEKNLYAKESILLETSSRRLDRQLSFVAQITSQLVPLLSTVDLLRIGGGHGFPIGEEDADPAQWLELFQPFTHVTWVDVLERRLVPGIVQALVMEDMDAEVLPELSWLSLMGYSAPRFVANAAMQFVARRRLSGRGIALWG
jgi:hypothetical protein